MSGSTRYYTPCNKIDNERVQGLLGVEDSLAYKTDELASHHHNRERWLGKSGDQSGNNWAINTLTPFRAISGADDYGGDANDEAKVLGTDDTPIITGMVKFDFREIFITATSVDTPYKLRIITGSGTMANAITAGTYTEVIVRVDAANPQHSTGLPIEVLSDRASAGVDKVWIQAWNVTNNATIDFLIGLHEYVG